MPKKKELPLSRMEMLQQRLAKSEFGIQTAADFMDTIRYLDFCDPNTGLPTISQEWLIGSRGFIAGRLTAMKATYSKGKSSYLYLQYGAAQRKSDAFCFHIETEGAPSPADRVRSLGADPKKLLQSECGSLDDCFAQIDTMICEIRGGFGGSIGATGRVIKTRFTDPVDPDCESPILIGVDSLSELDLEKTSQQDVMDTGKVTGIGEVARAVRKFIKGRAMRLKQTQTALFITAHETEKIQQMPSFGGGDNKSFVAENAVAGAATFGINFAKPSNWYNKSTGDLLGTILHLSTFKNKWNPKPGSLDLFLTPYNGFDMIHTDATFLLDSDNSPFKNKKFGLLNKDGELFETCRDTRGRIICTALRDKTAGGFSSEEEFVRAFYENEDILSSCRERMRIRGFGHDWEDKYPSVEELDAATTLESEKSKDFMPGDFNDKGDK